MMPWATVSIEVLYVLYIEDEQAEIKSTVLYHCKKAYFLSTSLGNKLSAGQLCPLLGYGSSRM